MNPNRIKPGDRVKLLDGRWDYIWQEPGGDVEDPETHPGKPTQGYISPGVVVAGQKAMWRRSLPVRWYHIEGDGGWIVVALNREGKILEWLPDHGPMGALVIDDMSGDDVCADA